MAKADPGHLIAVNKALKEAVARHKSGVSDRSVSDILISPDEIAGAYDLQRNLLTTLGGNGHRPITPSDIEAFAATARLLGKKAIGGITAQRMLDTSMPGPRERAHKEIHTAIPIQARGGTVTFQTNAGPKSIHRRHMVRIVFLEFENCVVNPAEPKSAVTKMLKGKLKIDCNCEDWRYRLRYIATIGGWEAGPWFESAYPKITNPLLHGCGCKHALRVMTSILGSPTFKSYAIKMITDARTAVERVKSNNTVKAMKEYADKLAKESYRQRRVVSSDDKKAERERWKQTQAMKASVADVKKAAAEQARKAEVKDKRKAISDTKKAIKSAQSLMDNPRTSEAIRLMLRAEIADRQADIDRMSK
jgi:hypothetical protein